MLRKNLIFIVVIFMLAACGQAATPVTVETIPSATPPVVVPTEISATATQLPSPTPTEIPIPQRAQYTLHVEIDYAARFVSVEQQIVYPNHSDQAHHELILAAVPNLWAGTFSLQDLTVDQTPAHFTLGGQRLTVELPTSLLPGQVTQLDMRYTLALPFAEQKSPTEQRPRIFGYTARQMNLTNWYPFVVPFHPENGWLLHDPWFYGEHLVYDAADFVVNLRFTDANPPVVAASAVPEQTADGWRQYRLEAGRTFAISASPEFQVAQTQVGDVLVSSYYFPLYGKGGEHVLQATVRAVELYSELFGPYPHRSITAVMGDFNDGMEYSAFYFLSFAFYNIFDGSAQNYLTLVAVHETAHQWWFERVANDQALEPWLDESLCTYSEYLYYERFYPDLTKWWWPYRMYYYDQSAWVDIPIYAGGGFHPYTNATYFRGAHFLHELRTQIGDEAFFSFLRAYAEQKNRQIASATDFFAMLNQFTDQNLSGLLAKYFRD